MAKAATATAKIANVPSIVRTATIKAPNLQVAEFQIIGTAPYVQHRFYKKVELMKTMEEGPTKQSKGKKAREPRNFQKDFEESQYIGRYNITDEGWHGIPANGFRKAMVSACKLVDFVMTRAKLSIFILHDGLDQDGVPLVRITKGKPVRVDVPVRNADGSVDVRALPMWKEWGCVLRVRYDADQFTYEDVANLVERAGMQVGIGEGRPDSKKGCGMGWGTFTGGAQ